MPHRQMTITTAITMPPPDVAAAARAFAAAITARSARPAVAVCGCPYLVAVSPREGLRRERPLLRASADPVSRCGEGYPGALVQRTLSPAATHWAV